MKIPAPKPVMQLVAQRALVYARQYCTERGWSSGRYLYAYGTEGRAEIRSRRKHLVYQSKGTRPRLMKELEGKTIPFTDENGEKRFVKVKGVGQPGMVTLPGGVRVFRQEKWKHPGIKATHFMENSLNKAAEESKNEIQTAIASIVAGRRRRRG